MLDLLESIDKIKVEKEAFELTNIMHESLGLEPMEDLDPLFK